MNESGELVVVHFVHVSATVLARLAPTACRRAADRYRSHDSTKKSQNPAQKRLVPSPGQTPSVLRPPTSHIQDCILVLPAAADPLMMQLIVTCIRDSYTLSSDSADLRTIRETKTTVYGT